MSEARRTATFIAVLALVVSLGSAAISYATNRNQIPCSLPWGNECNQVVPLAEGYVTLYRDGSVADFRPGDDTTAEAIIRSLNDRWHNTEDVELEPASDAELFATGLLVARWGRIALYFDSSQHLKGWSYTTGAATLDDPYRDTPEAWQIYGGLQPGTTLSAVSDQIGSSEARPFGTQDAICELPNPSSDGKYPGHICGFVSPPWSDASEANIPWTSTFSTFWALG